MPLYKSSTRFHCDSKQGLSFPPLFDTAFRESALRIWTHADTCARFESHWIPMSRSRHIPFVFGVRNRAKPRLTARMSREVVQKHHDSSSAIPTHHALRLRLRATSKVERSKALNPPIQLILEPAAGNLPSIRSRIPPPPLDINAPPKNAPNRGNQRHDNPPSIAHIARPIRDVRYRCRTEE